MLKISLSQFLRYAVAGLCLAQSPLSAYELSRDLAYGDDERHRLDIYVPGDGQSDLPVLVWVHGGMWRGGDKGRVTGMPDYLVDQCDWVLVPVNYRFSAPRLKFPAHVEDLALALAWVRRHIAEYGGSPEKLVLVGEGSGGQMVALLGSDPRYLRERGLDTDAIQAVVAIDCGAFDLNAVARSYGGDLPMIYLETFVDDEMDWADFSPINYVAINEKMPHLIVACSHRKGSLIRNQSEAFFAALEKADVPGRWISFQAPPRHLRGGGFGTIGDELTREVLSYLEEKVLVQEP